MLKDYNRQAFIRAPQIKESWQGEVCVVVGSGPSLTDEAARLIVKARDLRQCRVIAVNDAYRLLPNADALYACDWGWWVTHDFVPGFRGKRFTSTSTSQVYCDDKSQLGARTYGIVLIEAKDGKGFGVGCLHYGSPGSSGFQAVNLALLHNPAGVVLVGFDMHTPGGRSHFFGEHPEHLRRCPERGYRDMARAFPPDPRIVNATPDSALTAYPFVPLEVAIAGSLHRDRAIA